MIRRPPRSTQSRSSAASDVYKRQTLNAVRGRHPLIGACLDTGHALRSGEMPHEVIELSLIHISEPTRLLSISYAVFCLKKKNTKLLKLYYQSHTYNI